MICQHTGTFAPFEGDFFKDPATFWDVFSQSHGLAFFVSLFSHITAPPDIGISLLSELLSVLSHLLKLPEEENIERALMDLNAFEVMAYFLLQCDPAGFTLSSIVELQVIASLFRDRETCIAFLRKIVFTAEIWIGASPKLQQTVVQSWSQHARSFAETLNFLTPAFLLEIVDLLLESGSLSTGVRGPLVQLLGDHSESTTATRHSASCFLCSGDTRTRSSTCLRSSTFSMS
jgi:hypothetical protein